MAHLHDYETVSTIGTGAYGTCYKIRKKSTGQFFVWKTINYGSLSSDQKKVCIADFIGKLNNSFIRLNKLNINR